VEIKAEISRTINLKDFGIEHTEDATPIVVEALKKCKEEGISKLVFPQGTYHFYPTFAPDRYCAITNNDNGLKRTSFPLWGFNDFEIEGNGSEFIFHGKMVPFILENSNNITIKNFSINWDVPFCLEGDVVANDPANKTFDLKVKTPFKVENGHLYLRLEREDSPYERKYGYRFAAPEKYHLEVGQNIIFDPETRAPVYNEKDYSGFGHASLKAEELENGNVRIYSIYKEVAPVGTVFCSKGEYLFNRTSPAFRLFKSRDIKFNNINVHHAGAMGLIAERCENITLDGFNVVLKEGQGRMVTTTADATHFCNCKGLIIIRNSIFENMLDDATNIHGTYGRVNMVLDDYRVAFETYHPHQNDYLFAEAGDSVQIIHKNTLQPTSEVMVVKKVERINEKISILTFGKSVKGKVEKYDGIENVSWYPSAILENNVVRNNRARSFLISTPRKVLVRNNHFSSEMTSLRITGDLGLWNESGPCDSLIIEGNTFGDCVYGGGKAAVIKIDPQYASKDHIQGKYSKGIIIKDNHFKTFDSSILDAISVDGLVFTGNKIEPSNSYKPLYPELPTLNIVNCNNVFIGGNTFKTRNGLKAKLEVDNKTTNLTLEEKSLFNKNY
jgi:hypothetical protein